MQKCINFMVRLIVILLIFSTIILGNVGCTSNTSKPKEEKININQNNSTNDDLLRDQIKFTNDVHQQGIDSLTE